MNTDRNGLHLYDILFTSLTCFYQGFSVQIRVLFIVKRYYKPIVSENQPSELLYVFTVKCFYAIGMLFKKHLIDLGNIGDHLFCAKIWINVPFAVFSQLAPQIVIL